MLCQHLVMFCVIIYVSYSEADFFSHESSSLVTAFLSLVIYFSFFHLGLIWQTSDASPSELLLIAE